MIPKLFCNYFYSATHIPKIDHRAYFDKVLRIASHYINININKINKIAFVSYAIEGEKKTM
ncbi:MAG: hypothetical protein DHS20C09_03580 [marine bacterium B5-7]|nr:MAG: hypothetical protein DHS20C09_03580 [marine bacterium B5-7]